MLTRARPNVLIVTHNLTLSGAPRITLILARLLQRDYTVTVVSPVPGALEYEYRQSDVKLTIDSEIANNDDKSRGFIAAFDLIIVSTTGFWNLVLQAKQLNKTVVWMIHDALSVEFEARNDWKKALLVCDAIVFPSEATHQKFSNWLLADNHHVILYGLDYLRPRSRLVSKKDNCSKVNVLHVGIITPRKGQDVLVQSIELLHQNGKQEFEFVFIGGRKPSKQVYAECLIAQTAEIPGVIWLGELDHDATLSHIMNCDILVCTSREDPSPLVVLEALVYGKVIISTPVGVMRDVITDGINGALVPYGDYEHLARTLQQLGQNVTVRERLSTAAQITAQIFDATRYYQEVKALINSLLE